MATKWRPDRLLSIRKKMGLTRQKLAEKIGVDRASIYNWERGLSQPTSESLVMLCQVTGKPMDYFYTGGGK